MKEPLANYNNAAWFYDRLSRLVYGNCLLQAQEHLLNYVTPGCRLLIAGGGTGKILEALARRYPTGLSITYAEVSERMIALSKARNAGNNQISFITAPAETVKPDQPFDVILVPFLLDNFTDQTTRQFIQQLNLHLKPGGLWLCADFQLSGRWWQPILLKSMYLFFKMMHCVSVSRLPDIVGAFEQNQCEYVAGKDFYAGFIHTAVYRKASKF